MKFEVPINVDIDDVTELIHDLQRLQTYKLGVDDATVLVSLDDVADVFADHIRAKRLDKDIDVLTKWIPVSERLPEKDGIYLVSGGGKVWSAQCLTFGCFRGWSNDVRNPAVSAWMPLPEPYKEGEENENVN